MPAQELRSFGQTEDVIRVLHPFYSSEFQFCGSSAEKRLQALFEVKDKWTYGELEAFLKPFVEPGANFDSFLMKNARVMKEKNQFARERDVTYYVRKF